MIEGFKEKLYDVEHALVVYALSFVTLPAFAIYDQEILERFKTAVRDCHIYLIGLLPKVELKNARQEDNRLTLNVKVAGERLEVSWPVPSDMKLQWEEGAWFLLAPDGKRYGPPEEEIFRALQQQTGALKFKVLYIGQAYGADGSRNAVDRLKKHETLQKIAVQGYPGRLSIRTASPRSYA